MQVVFSPGAEIKFEGANNFRELGGYRAADGRQVKYGLLYRGGNLDLLKSEADHARLASLGLREILDLRSAGESAAHPDPAVPGAHYQRVCGMRNADGTEMDFSGQGIERLRQEKEAFERSVGRPVHDFEWFSALYREMPFRNPAYHALFALLESRRVPVLFHCSCGKDRTGIGAMLMVGQPSARAAASERWVSSVCLDGRYRAFLPKNRRLKKPTARPAMTPTPCSFVSVRA